jgi:cyclopropane-fatty-acyl-phospholipid synthase
VLEIGCGWGGLAEIAAGEFGAHVTGVTLSREQLQWGQARMQARAWAAGGPALPGLPRPGRAAWTPLRRHRLHRDVRGRGPRILARLLRDPAPASSPAACIQTITIRDDLFERYVRSTDFIQQYIFPGGLLPSPRPSRPRPARRLRRRAAPGLRPDYAETLRRWREAFLREIDTVQRLGFDARFQRIWAFYLAYCEAAFDTGNTDVIQFTLRKPLP